MPTATRKRYLEELDPVEMMAVLDEGARKFNEECARLGVSRVVEIDGRPALYHPDGSHTFLPTDLMGTRAKLAYLDKHNYKVSLKDVRYP